MLINKFIEIFGDVLQLCYVCATMANKSNPIGIRFDLEKLNFVRVREKLGSNQKVVDYLLNDYWWRHKDAVVSAKESPPLYLKKEEFVSQDSGEVQKSVSEWASERMAIETEEDYKLWSERLDACGYLSEKQKDLARVMKK